jgi:glycosyltransferase involved in cell wall biosynthesis
MKKGISIIICCYNSAGRLHETLQHLMRQQTKGFDWEIIVVDNASTDSTTAVSQQILAEKLPSEKYKIVQEPESGLSSARRKGYLTSKYQYLLFCDDDNWMKEDYLQIAFEAMEQNKQIGILGGTGEAVFEKEKPFWFDKYQINFAVGQQSESAETLAKVEAVYGAGFILRREIFETLDAITFKSLLSDRKGNQLMSGGDTELCLVTNYLGYDVYCSMQLQFKHLMPAGRMSWDYLKKLYYGFGRMRLYSQAYKQLETRTEVPGKNLRLPLWLDKYLHRLKELKYYLPQILFKLNEEGNDAVLKYLALRGELYELRKLKKNYSDVFFKIATLRSRINVLKGQK